MKVQRYYAGFDGPEEDDDGEFVKYEDYERLVLLCRNMLPVFEAARPLVLSLERLKDAARSIE